MRDLVIKKIAVLGAGVMGAQIAAHCANAGFATLLFDLPNEKVNLAAKAIQNLTKIKPAPLATGEIANYIEAKTYDEMQSLKECDLIIEAIGERLDWKESLYKKITPYINEKAIITSNTSGLSINNLSSFLTEELAERFCGVHFFNPPRYMHLVEVIPASNTNQDLLDKLEIWLTSRLGKGVVRAKDTPNFIANRIGVFSLLATIYYAEKFQLSPQEVDLLTGERIGRPKSATFRTMDVVGLDTLKHVVDTMHNELKNDPWHYLFKLPFWINNLIEQGNLGQKTGKGIYKKTGQNIEVINPKTNKYEAGQAELSPALQTIFREANPKKRMQSLMNSEDKQAQFLAACYQDLMQYCAFHLTDIATTVADIDLAMRWGFGWNQGPFEIWQEAGIDVFKAQLPDWVNSNTLFYTEQGAYSPQKQQYLNRLDSVIYKKQIIKPLLLQDTNPQFLIIYQNDGVMLKKYNDSIVLLSFKSKANTFNQAVLEGLNEALSIAEKDFSALIIFQDNANTFSAGANLQQVAEFIKNGKAQDVEKLISYFQQTVMRIKYSAIPVVAALRGKALGGGCELLMHCSVVAAFESYPGLVEIGVGLIPAGGGCKELALRASSAVDNNALFSMIKTYFEQLAMGMVANSALEAKKFSYLKNDTPVVMHNDELLYAAISKVNYLLDNNYQSPVAKHFAVAGREGHARLQAGLLNWLEGGFISTHDYFIGSAIANVLCGGDVNEGTLVDEAWILALEKNTFMQLTANELSQQRIAHLLTTGKPLRN